MVLGKCASHENKNIKISSDQHKLICCEIVEIIISWFGENVHAHEMKNTKINIAQYKLICCEIVEISISWFGKMCMHTK